MKKGPTIESVLAKIPLPDVTPTDARFLDHVLLSAMDRAEAGLFVIGEVGPHARSELLHRVGSALLWRDPSLIALTLDEPIIPLECARTIWTKEEDGNYGRLDMLIRRVALINPAANVITVDSIQEPTALEAAFHMAKSRLVVVGMAIHNASEVPRRLLSMGAQPREVIDCLRGAFVQRTYQRPCAVCALRAGSPLPTCNLEPRLEDTEPSWWLTRNPARAPLDEDAHCQACDRERTIGEIFAYEMFAWNADLREHLHTGDLDQLELAIEYHMARRGHELFVDRAIRYARRGLVYVEDLHE